MKRLIFVLLFLTATIVTSYSQPTNDSTKYTWYRTQYGIKIPRIWPDSFQHIPYGDTSLYKPGSNYKSFVMTGLDGNVYKWINNHWENFSGGGTPANPTSSFQFNNSGAFGAARRFTFNNSNQKLLLDSADFSFNKVDSLAITINNMKSGTFMKLNYPHIGFAGYRPFLWINEDAANIDVPGTYNNPVKWGPNANRAYNSALSGYWFSMEPYYAPSGANMHEMHYQAELPDGEDVRLMSSTMLEHATLFTSSHTWDFRSSLFNFNTLTDTNIVGISRGQLSIFNAGATSASLMMQNGSDVSYINNQSGFLLQSGLPFETKGEINLYTANDGTSTGRAGLRMVVDGGNTSYLIGYPSAYSDASLRNWTVLTGQNLSSGLSGIVGIDYSNHIILGDQTSYSPSSEKVQFFGNARAKSKLYWDTPDSLTSGSPANIAWRDPSNGELRTAPYNKILRGLLSSYTFASISAGTSTSTTVTVTGAVPGDIVQINTSDGSAFADGEIYDARVSANDTITIRRLNTLASSTLSSGTKSFNVMVFKY